MIDIIIAFMLGAWIGTLIGYVIAGFMVMSERE